VRRLEERKAKAATEADSANDGKKPGSKAPSKKKPGRPPKHPSGKPKPKDQENFTDPDSRIMKTGSNGFQQSYNAQIAVDDTAHLIVAANVGQNAADVGSLIPTLDPDHEHRKETRSLACRRGLPIGRQLLEVGRQRGSCVHSLGTAGRQGRRTPTSPPLRA